MNYKNFFKGKKITMLGLGVLGRGVNVAKFLSKNGTILTITDLKTKEQLAASLKELKGRGNIKYVLGKHRLEDFQKAGMVIKAAGVPLDSPYVKEARKNKIPVEMDASLFSKFSPATIIGITGTRGKSTVTHLLHLILEKAGRKVFLGGNVKGLATLPLLEKTKAGDVVVLELDSWQLQGFGDSKLSPQIAVFTTFLDDHLNYYKGNRAKYFSDKANIFKYQKKDNLLIVGKQAYPAIKKFGIKSKGKIIISPEILPKGWKINLPGKHNEYNARLAIEVARMLKISDATIKKAIADFSPVPGRLELIRILKGVKIYNDTNSTTSDATIVALHALGVQGPTLGIQKGRTLKNNIILILGGADKGLDMTKLVREIPKYCKTTIFLSGSGTKKLKAKSYKLQAVDEYDNLSEAVAKAYELASKGDIILFSPAFASFGMFKNEYDRGEQFNKIVSRL